MKVPKRAVKTRSFKAPRYALAAQKQVWLTFDDGPHPTCTGKVLDVLSLHGITACFFLIGKHAEHCPAVVARILREGHRICNHTYSHPLLTKLTAAKVKLELQRTERILADALKAPKLFRPPFGTHNSTVDSVSRGLGYRTVIWNVDTVDWNRKYQPTRWVTHGLAQIRARSSSVVLMHDIHASTAHHLDSFIRKIKQLGNVRFMAAATL